MDVTVLRTFLEVNRTRHFAHAAENLFVTQAAVSARIRQLEAEVGSRLFTRSRNNIQLTVAGRRLVSHAEAIVNRWNQALLETAVPSESKAAVVLGCQPSIWETYLAERLVDLQHQTPSAWLQIELLAADSLVRRLRENSVSLGLLYEPPQAHDLVVDHLTEVTLVMVSATPGLAVTDELPGYIYVDWGTSFAAAHNAVWQISAAPILQVDTPGLAYRFLLDAGGTAYLPQAMIAAGLESGDLHTVAGAPEFVRSAFIVRGRDVQPNDVAETVKTSLKRLVQGDLASSLA